MIEEDPGYHGVVLGLDIFLRDRHLSAGGSGPLKKRLHLSTTIKLTPKVEASHSMYALGQGCAAGCTQRSPILFKRKN